MILRSNTVINPNKALIRGNPVVNKICVPFFAILIGLFALFLAFRTYVNNDYSKDMLVADFRTDVGKLWEASKIIESLRVNSSGLILNEFGTTGKVLNSAEINQNLKRMLIKLADADGDGRLSEPEIQSLGIMCLKQEVYAKQLETLQFQGLSTDNNLGHYVVITRGRYAGTVLYNGCLRFIDSKKRYYLGVELFEQL